MESAARTFISSTYFPNGMEMAAALATLELLIDENVLDAITRTGQLLNDGLQQIVAECSLPVTLSPFPQMPFLHFCASLEDGQTERRDRFYAELAGDGVFAHPRHHGFLCWRHDQKDVDRVLEATRRAARRV